MGKRKRRKQSDTGDRSKDAVAEPGQPNLFLVDRIVDHRIVKKGKKVQFLVKWLNYSDADNTWEPESNLPRGPVFEYKESASMPLTAAERAEKAQLVEAGEVVTRASAQPFQRVPTSAAPPMAPAVEKSASGIDVCWPTSVSPNTAQSVPNAALNTGIDDIIEAPEAQAKMGKRKKTGTQKVQDAWTQAGDGPATSQTGDTDITTLLPSAYHPWQHIRLPMLPEGTLIALPCTVPSNFRFDQFNNPSPPPDASQAHSEVTSPSSSETRNTVTSPDASQVSVTVASPNTSQAQNRVPLASAPPTMPNLASSAGDTEKLPPGAIPIPKGKLPDWLIPVSPLDGERIRRGEVVVSNVIPNLAIASAEKRRTAPQVVSLQRGSAPPQWPVATVQLESPVAVQRANTRDSSTPPPMSALDPTSTNLTGTASWAQPSVVATPTTPVYLTVDPQPRTPQPPPMSALTGPDPVSTRVPPHSVPLTQEVGTSQPTHFATSSSMILPPVSFRDPTPTGPEAHAESPKPPPPMVICSAEKDSAATEHLSKRPRVDDAAEASVP